MKRLQEHGIKCYLSCDYNHFGKKIFWKGNYHCVEKKCEIGLFRAVAVEKENEIEVSITFANLEPRHQKLSVQLIISRDRRLEQQKSLAISGASNCIHFNNLFNETVTDPSKIKLFKTSKCQTETECED